MGTGGRPGYHRATVVGGGVIGISWTALFLAHGLEVTVCDPLPDVAERVRAGLREIAPTLAQLGLSGTNSPTAAMRCGSTRTRPAP
jgi:ketoreductase RED1